MGLKYLVSCPWYTIFSTWILYMGLCLSTLLVLLLYLSVYVLRHKLGVDLFAAFSSTQCAFLFTKKAYIMPFKKTHPKILDRWHVEAGGTYLCLKLGFKSI